MFITWQPGGARKSRPRLRSAARRGATLVELAFVTVVFLLLLVAIMEGGRMGFACSSVSFAAHRAARFAAVRGSGSGHPASASDIQAAAQAYIVALDNTKLTVTTTWMPDNQPGSTVQVRVSYGFATILVPLSSGLLTLETTARQVITQ